jgi:hypothetical protein
MDVKKFEKSQEDLEGERTSEEAPKKDPRVLTDAVMEEVAGGRPGFDHIPPQFSPAAQAAGT